MRTLRIMAALVLCTGAVFTARSFYLYAKAEFAGLLIRHAWTQTTGNGKPHAPWPWADTYPIARLRIARLGYDEIVLEGATPRTLAFGPARLQSAAKFRESGNVVIAGHRTSWFKPLEKIANGDLIRVEWLDSSHTLRARTYKVDVIRVVTPRDTRLLRPTDDDAVTLITCYPFGLSPSSPERFIVQAIAVDGVPRVAALGTTAASSFTDMVRMNF